MNIFVLSRNTKLCAKHHCDQHVVKMILEYAQMLSTAVRISGVSAGYKITHRNHPANKWVRESLSNWKWLRQLASELNLEYKRRYNHKENHKAFDVISILPLPSIPDIGLTQFPQCMPDEYKHKNVVCAYRQYYRKDKTFARWKNNKPSWL